MPIDKLTILWPQSTQNVNRGDFSNERKVVDLMTPITIRFTETDRWAVEEVARSINLTFSEFVRWCAIYAALEVKNVQAREKFVGKSREIDKTGFK